jgi:ABC-2 type transport system permease protein
MSKIFNIAWNDIRLEFSEPISILFFLILPVVFTAVIASALGSGGDPDPTADTRFPVLVVDEDQSDLSADFITTLDRSQIIRPLPASATEAQTMFDDGEAPALLTLPAGFGDSLLAGDETNLSLRTAPGDTSVLAIEQALQTATGQASLAVSAALSSVAAAEDIEPFSDEAARQTYFQQSLNMAEQLAEEPPARLEVTQGAAVNPQSITGSEQASSGQLVSWVLITLIGAAELLVNERLGGTLRRLLVTPTGKATIMLGKITGRLILGLVQMALLILIGALVFKVNWGRSPAALVVIMLAFALAAVAFGVMLGAFARTRSQANGLTLLSGLLMAALGGAWWPLEITPQSYQTAVKVLPTTWAMLGFNDVIVRGAPLSAVLPEAAILLLFATLFFTIGLWRFRYE